MPAYRDKKTGLFYVQFYYRDARGAKRHKTKKGFQTTLDQQGRAATASSPLT